MTELFVGDGLNKGKYVTTVTIPIPGHLLYIKTRQIMKRKGIVYLKFSNVIVQEE